LLKSNSSGWMNEHGMEFNWQEGYGAFSVSASNLGTVERYIADQERHHQKKTYEQEFEGLLRKHRIPFDPKYVFG
jgi:putative transposase